jgi:enoyl-CoA hydratase/carnithine racemase
MSDKIVFKSEGNSGTILLNNPQKLNAFDFEMIKEFNNVLNKIKKSSLKVIVIKGAGKSFCSGGDVQWEVTLADLDAKEVRRQIKFIQNVLAKMQSLPQIFIAVIHGYAVGGGSQLAMACDMRIASSAARFAHPEVILGTVPPLGATKRLPRLIGLGRAKYMLFTGESIDSKTALDWGLVDFVVPEGEVDSFLKALLSKIASRPEKALALIKKSLNKNYMADFQNRFELDCYVNSSRSKEFKEMIKNFVEKRKKT